MAPSSRAWRKGGRRGHDRLTSGTASGVFRSDSRAQLVDDPGVEDLIALNDWRRRVAEMYAGVRDARDPRGAWGAWRAIRDDLFAHHPATPLPEGARAWFRSLPYHDYEPSARVFAAVVPTDAVEVELAASDGRQYRFVRFATVHFPLAGASRQLDLFWLLGYGGGLFLPFADTTNGRTTYGAGRYILDTVKGADLGQEGEELILDFNFAYNPSCSYDPRWSCPLPPTGNRLDTAVEAGELAP
jgi:uncharacterized protein (DUF1684 family)